MKRRDALQRTSAVLGLTLIGGKAFLSGCDMKEQPSGMFSSGQVDILTEIAEVILPQTDRSPGAREARVADFIQRYVEFCYKEKDQVIFLEGLNQLEGAGITGMDTDQRVAYVEYLEEESAKAVNTHFYGMIKQLTVLGYFVSEAGVTKALRYDPIPGGYNGCVPYKSGAPAWYGPLSSIG